MTLFGKPRVSAYAVVCTLLIAATATTLIGLGRHSLFVLCDVECGENLIALHQARNLALTGHTWGLLEDFATSPDPVAHPFLYTHNVNLGSLIYVALETIGVHSIASMQLVALLIFLVGLALATKTVEEITRSRLIAALFLAFFCSDYYHVSAWGFNPLRGAHWLALFGLLLFLSRLARRTIEDAKVAHLMRVWVALGAAICFGIGYDFAAISAITATLVYFAFSLRPLQVRKAFMDIGAVGLGIFLAFAARQAQVISVTDLHFWWTDFRVSFLVKMPLVHNFLALPNLDSIDAYYASHHVWRPTAVPAASLKELLMTLGTMIRGAVFPSYGPIGALLMAGSAVLGLPVLFFRLVRPKGVLVYGIPLLVGLIVAVLTYGVLRGAVSSPPPLERWQLALLAGTLLGAASAELLRRPQLRESAGQSTPSFVDSAVSGTVFISALVLGAGLGMSVFAPVSFHFYLKHEFPLLGAPSALAKALVVAASCVVVQKACQRKDKRLKFGALGLSLASVLIVVGHFATISDNRAVKRGMPIGWIPFVMAHRDASYAVNWFSSTVAAFSHNWVAALRPGHEWEYLHNALRGHPPFTVSDYMLFGERDRSERAPYYSKPDYWIYFVREDITPFDAPAPRCRRNYLVRSYDALFGETVAPLMYADRPLTFGPSHSLHFVLFIRNIDPDLGLRTFLLQSQNDRSYSFAYNCIYENTEVELADSQLQTSGEHIYGAALLNERGQQMKLPPLVITIDPRKRPAPPESMFRPSTQPSIKEMVAGMRGYRVVDIGKRFVIFDLRHRGANN